MSIPDDDDLPPGRYGLSRRETFIGTVPITFIGHQAGCECGVVPYSNPYIVRVVTRLQSLMRDDRLMNME